MEMQNQTTSQAAAKQPFYPSEADIFMNNILYMSTGFMLAALMEQKISQLLYEAEAKWENKLSEHLDRLMETLYDGSK